MHTPQSAQRPDMNWSANRRQEFIEFRLFWDGSIGRQEIADFFGISTVQASKDIAQYQDASPDCAVYDASIKRHVRTNRFSVKYLQPHAAGYLSQLRMVAEGIVPPKETWLPKIPSFDVLPLPARGIPAATLRYVLDAIHSQSAIQISYQSMNSVEPQERWISPHAIAHDGMRWHVRAYCHNDDCFKDFVIARILKQISTRPSDIDPATDIIWNQLIDVVIAPHPELTNSQRRVIELDYGMTDGELCIPTRRAFVYYLKKRLCLDIDPSVRPAKEQHIILKNADEVARKLEGN